ncbi:MAG: S1/P1 nuclease [Betaproteobacteria bacterium]|nr:S1/P1 nuclease [Betaproteobacteria bacterium]MCL2885466.1 S1/P1 nuclease [Betaproteobacteria bacterium]
MRFFFLLCLLFCSQPALAWNAAGHRLIAVIAWQQLSAPSRQLVSATLAAHPDYDRWREKAGGQGEAALFAEAATWADSIRNDPRYYDEGRDKPTRPLAGRYDSRRHRSWHYVDFAANGRPRKGDIDRQIERLDRLLVTSNDPAEITYALPWLLHLVSDLHQPLHVGNSDDGGGTRVLVENPYPRGQPFVSLHAYWDDLPGPSSLRGRRLQRAAARLLAAYRPPAQGDANLWREESRQLRLAAYPRQNGRLSPIIDKKFQEQSRAIAERRLAEAGYRLGRLLETRLRQRVSRETFRRQGP